MTSSESDPASSVTPHHPGPGFVRDDALATYERVSGRPMGPSTPFRELTLDVMHRVWSRSGLSPRERRLITIAVLSMEGAGRELDVHVRAAIESGDLDFDALGEASMQLAMYGGWPRGATLQAVLAGVAADPGPAPVPER